MDGGVFTADAFGIWFLSLDPDTYAFKSLTVQGFDPDQLSFGPVPQIPSLAPTGPWVLAAALLGLGLASLALRGRTRRTAGR